MEMQFSETVVIIGKIKERADAVKYLQNNGYIEIRSELLSDQYNDVIVEFRLTGIKDIIK